MDTLSNSWTTWLKPQRKNILVTTCHQNWTLPGRPWSPMNQTGINSRVSSMSAVTKQTTSSSGSDSRWETLCVFSRYFECLLYPNGMWRHFNRSTIYIAPLPEGAPWRCRLGCEHDTLRLLLLRRHAGTQPIRPTCTPNCFTLNSYCFTVNRHLFILLSENVRLRLRCIIVTLQNNVIIFYHSSFVDKHICYHLRMLRNQPKMRLGKYCRLLKRGGGSGRRIGTNTRRSWNRDSSCASSTLISNRFCFTSSISKRLMLYWATLFTDSMFIFITMIIITTIM